MPLVVTRKDVPGMRVVPVVVMKERGNPIVCPVAGRRVDPVSASPWFPAEAGELLVRELLVRIERVSVLSGLEFSFKWSPFELLELMLLASERMSDSLRWITLDPRDADGGSNNI